MVPYYLNPVKLSVLKDHKNHKTKIDCEWNQQESIFKRCDFTLELKWNKKNYNNITN